MSSEKTFSGKNANKMLEQCLALLLHTKMLKKCEYTVFSRLNAPGVYLKIGSFDSTLDSMPNSSFTAMSDNFRPIPSTRILLSVTERSMSEFQASP